MCTHAHRALEWQSKFITYIITSFPKSEVWTVQRELIPSLQIPQLIKGKKSQQLSSGLPFLRFLQVTHFLTKTYIGVKRGYQVTIKCTFPIHPSKYSIKLCFYSICRQKFPNMVGKICAHFSAKIKLTSFYER